jgi:hypothetical protein
MEIEQFLKLFSPNFTLYGVLVTFGILSFKAFNIFFKYENTLREESFSRVKDLLGSFRRKYIEPVVRKNLSESVKIAYENAFSSLINTLYSEPRIVNGEIVQELVSSEDMKEILEKQALFKRKENLQNSADKDFETFFSAASGDNFFNLLDELYEKKSVISKKYKRAFSSCRVASYSFIILSLLMYLGIIQVLGDWPEWIVLLWCFISIQALMVGIVSSIYVEICRRDLTRRWEDLQFHDQV